MIFRKIQISRSEPSPKNRQTRKGKRQRFIAKTIALDLKDDTIEVKIYSGDKDYSADSNCLIHDSITLYGYDSVDLTMPDHSIKYVSSIIKQTSSIVIYSACRERNPYYVIDPGATIDMKGVGGMYHIILHKIKL